MNINCYALPNDLINIHFSVLFYFMAIFIIKYEENKTKLTVKN